MFHFQKLFDNIKMKEYDRMSKIAPKVAICILFKDKMPRI